MNAKLLLALRSALVIAFAAVMFSVPESASAASCTWTGNTDTDWHTASNWQDCGGNVPGTGDTATIPAVTNEPVISSDVTIAGLTVQGSSSVTINSGTVITLTGDVNNSGTISGGGTFRTDAGLTVNQGGTFSAPLEVKSGTTTVHGDTFAGTITVDSGATLHGQDWPSQFTFTGPTFTNNGQVTGRITFGGGTHSIKGAGGWTDGNLYFDGSSTTSLGSDVTVSVGDMNVHGGSTLSTGSSYVLTFSGAQFTNWGTVFGGGMVSTQGTVTLSQGGTFSAPLEVKSGTTNLIGDTFDGTITVDSGATLNGGTDWWSHVIFTGSTFTNNGQVTGHVTFGGTTQSIAGTGTWAGWDVNIGSPSTTSLERDMIISAGDLNVNGGATLSMGSHVLAFGGVNFTNRGTVSGSGLVRTQGTVVLEQGGTFSAPLEVKSGTTNVIGETFDGTITVDLGATLNGGSDPWSHVIFTGSKFTNNGQVTGHFQFGGTTQTLTGSGSFVGDAAILYGSTVTLTSDHQMSTVVINPGGALDISNRTLSLSGSGSDPPLSNSGTFTATGSTIVYNGSAAQNVATANVNYNNLTINNATGVGLPAAKTIPGTLTLTNGTFTVGSNLTLGNGATISRAAGTLSAAPTFGTSVNVIYTGSNSVTTSYEIPTDSAILANLTVNKSGGADVTLGANTTVNGVLSLTSGDLRTNSSTLTMGSASAQATGSYDVVGNVSRTTFNTTTDLTFGSPNTFLRFSYAGAPSSATVTLVKDAPGGLTNYIKRKYTISITGGTSVSANVRLHYQSPGDLVGIADEAKLVLWRYDGSRWVLQGRDSEGTGNLDSYVQKNGVATFSDWAISDNGAPTGLTVVRFVARSDAQGVTLEWQTILERMTRGFQVERALDGKTYAAFGAFIPTKFGGVYSVRDNTLKRGQTASYRLVEISTNGTRTTYGPITGALASDTNRLFLPAIRR